MFMNSIHIDKLIGKDDYHTWKFAAKAYLEHEDLWSCVDPDNKETVDVEMDVKAKSMIILLVDPSNYHYIEQAVTARDMWLKLKSAFEDSGLRRKVALVRDLINTNLNSCVNIEDYVNKVATTADKLRSINFNIEDEMLGALMLAGLPEQYKPLIMAIEYSGVEISADYIKNKLLQGVKMESDNTAKQRYPRNKKYSPQNDQPKPHGPRCHNCNKHGHLRKNCFNYKKENANI